MLVSICIPTYNGGRFIVEAVRSALSQSGSIELVISDSGSSDDTLGIIRRECAGASVPVTILDHSTPGMAANWNALVRAARGEWIKFLFQDDLLGEECVGKMLEAANMDSRVGLVFCRRKVLIEPGAESSVVASYLLKYPELHKGFANLDRIQSGRLLIGDRKLLDEPLNKIGEPSAVMIRKEVALSAGLFNERMRQLVDWEFWLRMMDKCHVGFVNEQLASFRVHGDQASAENSKWETSDSEGRELLGTLASLRMFGQLHRRVRVKIYREAMAAGIAVGAAPSVMDQVYDGLCEAYHGGRKAFHVVSK